MKVLVVIVLLACITLSLGLDNARFRSSEAQERSHSEVRAYWTSDRMRNAIPRDGIVRDGEPNPVTSSEGLNGGPITPVDQAEPVYVEGQESLLFPSDIEDEVAVPVNGNQKRAYPFPYTAGYAPTYTTYPWRVVGKIFFSQGGLNYVCSGSAIGKYTVATAGHCVYDAIGKTGWVTNFVFVPGYNNGNAPYGTWSAHQLFSSTDWTTYGSFCRDYGFAVLRKNNNLGIGDVVGTFGYLYNAAQSQTWRSLGYPAASPFNGQTMYYTDSALGVVDSNCGGRCATTCAPSTSGIGSDATGGTSGGPWVINFGSNNYLNSVNSYKYNNQPAALYGPYFDASWVSVLNNANAIVPP